MTTSGTQTFTYNRDQIIRRAARLTSAIQSGETPDSQTIQDFADALNSMVKQWQATGLHVWTQGEAFLFTQPDQVQYAIGATSTDHCSIAGYDQTTTTTAASSGANQILVTSIVGISSGDNIGVVLAGGSIQWTTVNGAPSGSTVTLTANLTDNVLAGAMVLSYTVAQTVQRPLRVIAARRRLLSSNIDTPMQPMLARQDYFNLPNKTSSGIPMQAFYDPQLVLGQLYIWPAPPDATNAVRFTWWRQIQDFNIAGDTPDFPQEWINCLVYNLAKQMAPEFGVPPEQWEMIKEMAAETFEVVSSFDREPESIFFGVNFGHR